MNDVNTVWVSTVPRTGSMWIYNVTRDLFRSAGKMVQPQTVPKESVESVQLANQFAFPCDDDSIAWVFKVHGMLGQDVPRSKIITTHRDPRDVIVSLIEFMGHNFDNALHHSRDLINFSTKYCTFDPSKLLTLAYAHIESRPVELVSEIAQFIGVNADANKIEAIAMAYSKDKVKQLIKTTEQSISEKVQNKIPVDKREVIVLSENHVRAFDVKTGFQSGHISNRQAGDWQKILTAEQLEQIKEVFGPWMTEFGYDI